jgi:hypothetical protein
MRLDFEAIGHGATLVPVTPMEPSNTGSSPQGISDPFIRSSSLSLTKEIQTK